MNKNVVNEAWISREKINNGKICIKQPNGLRGIFSTIVDCPIYINLTKEDYIKIKLAQAKAEIEKDADEFFAEDYNDYTIEDVKDYFHPANMTRKEFNEVIKKITDKNNPKMEML